MQDVDKILYKMGYLDADAHKRAEVQGYIDEATEFMREAGVPDENIDSQRAYAVKAIWADYRDKGDAVALISQLKR